MEIEERAKTIDALRENNRKIERILSNLKSLKADIVTLDTSLTHIFDDLISKILLVLQPVDLNKFDLEIFISRRDIFFKTKMRPLSKKRGKPMNAQISSYLQKRKKVMIETPKQ